MIDSIDRMTARWGETRPEVDVTPLGVVQRIIKAGRLAEARLRDALAVRGVRVRGDYETLAALRRNEPASLTPHELATETLVSSAGMTSRLDRLEAGGFIERHTDSVDRRSVNVTLTDAGRALIDDLFMVSVEEQAAMLSGFEPAAVADLADGLHRFLVNLGDR